ncbi:tetratricopeptide repeat protein, partial [Actinoplanes xinjiangensis]|uniref:tetratricopeptide repeat protein n=1 Tax=Actinoplanes xinjiangensis TaxID=512350 RepID=UPI0034490BE1
MSRSPLTPAIERARALIASGDLGSAQVLLERAVELGRENLGEDEPDVLTAQRELAGVFLQSDDPMAARRILEDAYAAGQWRLGDGDPLMLHISYDLGIVAQELGNRHEARKAFGRVAANGPAALGEGHQFVVHARSYLGEDSSVATVRPDAPPTTALSVVPTPPVADVAPATHQAPVQRIVTPVADVTPAVTQATPVPRAVTPGPVPRPRGGDADARAALERPTDVLPVTRSGHVSRAETTFIPQPQPQPQPQWHPLMPEPGHRSHSPLPNLAVQARAIRYPHRR